MFPIFNMIWINLWILNTAYLSSLINFRYFLSI